MRNVISLIAGVMFGLGLAISGMTDTTKVIGFLDVLGQWQSDLAFVMASALFVTIIGFTIALKGQSPILDTTFHLPTLQLVDKRLVIGAILFGTGWGLYGYCPGPAIASIVYLETTTLVFLVSMVVGMILFQFTNKPH